MTEKLRFIDLFAGLGGIRIPFDELGYECVFTSEIDDPAAKMYENHFGEKPSGDITAISETEIPDHDLLLGGFPCQAFSIMGERKGFEDTRGTLFFDIQRILSEKNPKAFLLENVKQLRTHDKGRTFAVIIDVLTQLGYHVHTKVLNALDFGVPQTRQRTFIVGFKQDLDFSFPSPSGYTAYLGDILESDDVVDLSLFVSDKIAKSRRERCKIDPFEPSIWHENKSGNNSVLPHSCALRASASYNYLLVNGRRRPSGREFMRLQGFPDDYEIVVPYTQIRKQAGNAVAVPVIRAVAREMAKSLKSGVSREQKKLRLAFERRPSIEQMAKQFMAHRKEALYFSPEVF